MKSSFFESVIKEVVEISALTQTKTLAYDQGYGFDVLARVSGGANSETEVKLMHTKSLFYHWERYISEAEESINLLRGVVNWQHKVIDYNASYAALLLEQINEEEFEKIAEEYACASAVIPDFDLAKNIKRVHDLTGIDYSSMDYSNMFGCSQDAVEAAIASIGCEYVDRDFSGYEGV